MKIDNIKLITYFTRNNETERTERQFNNMNELKEYVKQCGGIKSFKWEDEESKCQYFITGEYNNQECYYEYKYGKYQWIDANGYVLR